MARKIFWGVVLYFVVKTLYTQSKKIQLLNNNATPADDGLSVVKTFPGALIENLNQPLRWSV